MSDPQGHYGTDSWQPNPYVERPVNPYDPPVNPYSWQPAPSPYAAPYGLPYALPDHPQATTVFVLGLLSLLLGGITAPFALVLGRNAKREMSNQPGRYRDGGLLTAGWVMGIVGTIYLGLMVLLVVFYAVLMIVAFSMTS